MQNNIDNGLDIILFGLIGDVSWPPTSNFYMYLWSVYEIYLIFSCSHKKVSLAKRIICIRSILRIFTVTALKLQGAAPKKPYNPVLGEVFRCYWDIPGGKRTAPNVDEQVVYDFKVLYICCIYIYCAIHFHDQRLVETSPVEFAGYDSLSLLAEQVSHHPPGVCASDSVNISTLLTSSMHVA